MTEEAKTARNEYMKAWRKANPDKVRQYRRQYRADHPDKIKAAAARHWERVAQQRKAVTQDQTGGSANESL